MRCPKCASLDTQVKDSRPTEDSAAIRRRRVCLSCNFRFTTFERVQLRELTVIKRNGRRLPFDRDKLARSVEIALRKRNVEPERIEQTVSKIVQELESLGESEVTSETIGESVMAHLRELTVIRRNGRRLPFDRDKLARSVEIALRKRNVEPERIEQTVSKIVQELESLGESEVSSETIGETVMAHLRDLDDVAYVRFASVYRNFREAKDFEMALAELASEDEPPKAAGGRK